MSVAAGPQFAFDNSYVRELEGLFEAWRPVAVAAPRMLVLNEALAAELGLDVAALASPEGVAVLAGNVVPDGAASIAQAYSGHQFGGFSPRLGDGRALLLGELIDTYGRRRDLHFKGSGRTPFSRGGDGRAAVGPMLREHLVGEAMHALGIPTTRSLAVVATGEDVVRETLLPGAVLTRVAASHLRVGTFQFAAAHGDAALVRRLADHAIARHHPQVADAADPYLGLLEAVVEVQAALIAQWMLVGFVHGVMNTDNMTISGETIDYGPCAFMEAYDPATVFSSIDHGGRYAYGNQPAVAQWNLARLAETLLGLMPGPTDAAVEAATDVLATFEGRFSGYWRRGMRDKLGFVEPDAEDEVLAVDLLALMQSAEADYTQTFRALAASLRGEDAEVRALFADDVDRITAWGARWSSQVGRDGREPGAVADAMDAVNPLYIPRNELVEAALTDATVGEPAGFEALLDVVRDPFVQRPGLERYAAPAGADAGAYRTFCGT